MPSKYLHDIADHLTTSIRSSLSQPPKRLIQAADGITELPGLDRRPLWVLSRRLLRQAVFDLPENLPPTKRKSALDLLVRKWSPYKSTDYAVQWVDNKASVYAWDQKHVENDIVAAGHNPKRFSIWPETFLREPLTDGVRLSRVADGLEGQIWRGGFLTGTRWWSEVPSAREWLMFLRTAGIDLSGVSQDVPEPTESYILPTPWTVNATSADDIWSLLQTERFVAIAATIVIAPFLYLLGQALILSVATGQSNAAMDELSETNQTVRISRSTALTNLDNIEAYLSLELFPPQYEIISNASNILQGRDLVISEWVYDNGNLELALESSSPLDSTFFIEAFEGSRYFSNVSGTSGVQQKSLRLNMQVAAQEWPAQ